MAKNLVKKGYAVTVYDVTEESVKSLVEAGERFSLYFFISNGLTKNKLLTFCG